MLCMRGNDLGVLLVSERLPLHLRVQLIAPPQPAALPAAALDAPSCKEEGTHAQTIVDPPSCNPLATRLFGKVILVWQATKVWLQ